MKKSIISGITGQDGAYLARLLLEKGYQVHGTHRHGGENNFWRLEELGIRQHPSLHLIEHDLSDLDACIALVERINPDEIYNLAAQSSVALSFTQPYSTAKITSFGALNFLEAVRLLDSKARFFQAGSSELYGTSQEPVLSEKTPFYPKSPYAVAKLNAYWNTLNYRENYGIFGCNGILFNHESPLRGQEFVTRKISDSVARISTGKLDMLNIGNLDSRRDWGYAEDFTDGMWRMLQADGPDDYVLATGRAESVRDFVLMAFKAAGISVAFRGSEENETAVVIETSLSQNGSERCLKVGQTVLRVNPLFYRPVDSCLSVADPSKAKEILGWSPSTTLEQICQSMVNADLARLREDTTCYL
jgi:GDPmannose 4,6-dehydratase